MKGLRCSWVVVRMTDVNNHISTNNSRINKDVIKLTITRVLTTTIATLTSMLLARYRTLEEYGTYSQMLIVINLMTSIFMLGLPSSLQYFLSRAETTKEKQEFVSVYYTLSTILSFILGLSLMLSANLIAKYFDNPYINSFLYFLALYPWTKITISSIENLLIVYKKTKNLLIIRLVHNILLLGLVGLFVVLKISFEIYMIVFVLFEVSFTIFDYFIVRKTAGSLRPLIIFKMVKSIFKFSIPIGVASIIGMINIEVDKLAISHFFSTEELGIYSACSTELPLTVVASSISSVALPVMVSFIKNGEISKAIEKWKKTVIVSFAIITIFSVGLFFFAEDAVLLLYGEKYLPGANVFRIYSLVLLFKCTYFGMILNSYGKTKFILFSSIISLLCNIGLNYLFYSMFGFIGPAISTLVSTFVMNLIQLVATSRIAKIKFSDIFPWRQMFMLLLLCLTIGIFFNKVREISSLDTVITTVGESVLLGAIWSAIYFALIFKTILRTFKEI